MTFDQLADKAEADLVSHFLKQQPDKPPYEDSRPPSPMTEIPEQNDTNGSVHENEFTAAIQNQVQKAFPTDAANTASTVNQIDEIVTRTVSQLADTIQALIVPERLEREIQIADDWRNLCRAICNNARLINSKLSFTKREDITQNLEGLKPDFLQPHLLTWEAFLQHPLSMTVWRIMQMHNLFHDDVAWKKWWMRIQHKSKKQPWTKLATYTQALKYYECSSNMFWTQWSYNPTMMTVEDVTASLTIQADWLRAAGLTSDNGFRIVEKFYQTAKKVAESKAKVAALGEILKPIWPSGFIPQNIHYRTSPFDSIRLETFIDRTKALVSWPLENYRFDPETVWGQEDNGISINTDKDEKMNPSQAAQQFVDKMRQYSHVDETQRNEFMNFLSKNKK